MVYTIDVYGEKIGPAWRITRHIIDVSAHKWVKDRWDVFCLANVHIPKDHCAIVRRYPNGEASLFCNPEDE